MSMNNIRKLFKACHKASNTKTYDLNYCFHIKNNETIQIIKNVWNRNINKWIESYKEFNNFNDCFAYLESVTK